MREPVVRRSLYARAALFVLTGCGALVGATVVLSALILGHAEERLLEERLALVRVAGAFLEARLRDDVAHLVALGRAVLSDSPRPPLPEGAFSAGAVVLDAQERPVAGLGGDPNALASALGAGPLAARARELHDIAVSPLIKSGGRELLVVAAEVPGGGFVVGALHPAGRDVLDPMRAQPQAAQATLALIDRRGVLVTSTDGRGPFATQDHEGVLARAIEGKGEVRGRCHSCHDEGGERVRGPEADVLAFAPLPTLPLGLGALEPESAALGPALTLRRQLWQMGSALIGLFVLFAALSVRSVVRPIRRLTQAVARAEREQTAVPADDYGPDEIGELAEALDAWRRRMLDSREHQQTQQSVLRRVLQAQEDERRRVARELHDTVAQDLAALRLELERVGGREVDAGVRARLAALEGRAREMLTTVRTILLDLRLSLLETMGLVPAMRWLLERTAREQKVGTHFLLDGDETWPVPYETAAMLFRILQEALLNAVQHGGPDQIIVTLRLGPQGLGLTVEDDGRGFDPASLEAPRPGGPERGLGLSGMAERAAILGGRCEVTSAPGEGTTVCVEVP